MNPNINTINNFQQRGNNNNQDISCKDRIKQAWGMVPLFVRFVVVTTVLLYIFSWFLPLEMYLSNIPIFTIKKFHIWRLFTSVFLTASIFNIFFAFFSWIPDGIRLENTSGTMRYALNFLVNSILIQVLYCLTMLIISFMAGEGALKLPSSGLWPLIMAEITILCLANPDHQVMMFFVPCSFRAKYYPWALFAFFTILNMNLQFDILVGICYGYLFFYYLRDYIQFSDNFIMKLENNSILNKFTRLSGFVPLQTSAINMSFNAPNSQNTQNTQNNNQNNNSSNFRVESANTQPVTTPFKGKGTVVGKINFYLF